MMTFVSMMMMMMMTTTILMMKQKTIKMERMTTMTLMSSVILSLSHLTCTFTHGAILKANFRYIPD